MRILLVDDDAALAQALLAALKNLPGHDIRAATDGDQALETATAMGGVDLLITDVVMNPMDGFTLRDQVVTRYPAVSTILITGYDLSDYPEQTKYHQTLQKPFDAAALLKAVERELEWIDPNYQTAAVAPTPAPAQHARVTPARPVAVAPV